MKYFALGILLASVAVVGTPAQADWKESNRMHGYYSAAERDHVSRDSVKLHRNDVKNIQLALKEAGYKPGPIDGVYGRETTAAVKKFQMDRHLKGNGKINERTLGALRVNTGLDEDHNLNRNYN
jgi:peptidoglycan hydrolase-like protein with peptidoglycan-binding domain